MAAEGVKREAAEGEGAYEVPVQPLVAASAAALAYLRQGI